VRLGRCKVSTQAIYLRWHSAFEEVWAEVDLTPFGYVFGYIAGRVFLGPNFFDSSVARQVLPNRFPVSTYRDVVQVSSTACEQRMEMQCAALLILNAADPIDRRVFFRAPTWTEEFTIQFRDKDAKSLISRFGVDTVSKRHCAEPLPLVATYESNPAFVQLPRWRQTDI